jgi:hypothetical protein
MRTTTSSDPRLARADANPVGQVTVESAASGPLGPLGGRSADQIGAMTGAGGRPAIQGGRTSGGPDFGGRMANLVGSPRVGGG